MKVKRKQKILIAKIIKVMFGIIGMCTVVVEGYPLISALILGIAAGANEYVVAMEKEIASVEVGPPRDVIDDYDSRN